MANKFELILDDDGIGFYKSKGENNLCELRENLVKSKNLNDFVFLNKKNKTINKDSEKDYELLDILIDNEIHLKTVKSEENKIIYNEPMKNSEEITLDKNSKIKYYKYPNIDLSEDEEKDSKIVLIVGKTGHGKSTFINALANIYSGINIHDKFRYLIIDQQKKENIQNVSDTQEITIYNLRPKDGLNYPPLKIIDTPGFQDTEGEKKDIDHIKKFQEIFEKKLITVNCICFIMKEFELRQGLVEQKLLINIMNLFSENIRENFLVGVTHFEKKYDGQKPDIVEKSLLVKDSFYYKNILKEKDINTDDWFFGSENAIIISNKENLILSDYAKEQWEKTKKGIEKFINKVNILKVKKIKESLNVINTRMEIEMELEGLPLKMENILIHLNTINYNINQINELLQDSEIQQKIISELEFTKKNTITILEEYKKNKSSLQNNLENITRDLIEKNNKYKELEDRIYTLKENIIKPVIVKKIYYNEIKTKRENIVCKRCHNNCHINCSCILSNLSNRFCSQFSFGNCKICNHETNDHLKCNYYYKPYKKDIVVNLKSVESDVEELNEILFTSYDLTNEKEQLSNKKLEIERKYEEDNKKLDELDTLFESGVERLKNLNQAVKNFKIEDEKRKNIILLHKKKKYILEIELLKIFNKIKNDLCYLRKNAFNKYSEETTEKCLERVKTKIRAEYSKIDELKSLIDELDNLKRKYFQLEKENIQISDLTYEKYLETIKN